MAVKIRFRQTGRKNKRMFRIVAADSRSPRDGKCIETLGHYNPHLEENGCVVKEDRLEYWLSQGAQFTDRAKRVLNKFYPKFK